MELPEAPVSWSATEVVAALKAGYLSCVEYTEILLARILERDIVVGAWEYLDPDLALARASRLDATEDRGPFHGIPFGVKDIIDTYDLATSYGSPIYRDHQPPRDATCVALARRAGGNMIGKTVTTEFANVTPGRTRNPLDPSRTPGGSSSGSAAAVADGMVPLAIGTQTTGSTIRPASFCGVIGFRPTFGDLSTSGVLEVSRSLDTLGILARTVEDVCLLADVIRGAQPDPLSQVWPARVGFVRSHYAGRLPPEIMGALDNMASQLDAAGAFVEEIEIPADFAGLEEAHRWIAAYEMSRSLAWEIDHRWDLLSEDLRDGRIADGMSCSVARYREMLERGRSGRRALAATFECHDVLLVPGAGGEATVGTFPVADPWIYQPWSMLHVPSISLPLLKGPAGLPVGAQLVGAWQADRRLLGIAAAILDVVPPPCTGDSETAIG